NANCPPAADGIAYVTVSGGVAPYSYSWVGYPNIIYPDNNDSLYNLVPNLYTVSITDSNGCTKSQYVLVQSSVISSTANAIAGVGCRDSSNAVAVATASGGVAPYTFVW